MFSEDLYKFSEIYSPVDVLLDNMKDIRSDNKDQCKEDIAAADNMDSIPALVPGMALSTGIDMMMRKGIR